MTKIFIADGSTWTIPEGFRGRTFGRDDMGPAQSGRLMENSKYNDGRHIGPYDVIGTPRPAPFARDIWEREVGDAFAAMRRSNQNLAMYERPR